MKIILFLLAASFAATASELPVGFVSANQSFAVRNGNSFVNSSLDAYEGKILVVMMMTPWCPYCQSNARAVGTGILSQFNSVNRGELRGKNDKGVEIESLLLSTESAAQWDNTNSSFANSNGYEQWGVDANAQRASPRVMLGYYRGGFPSGFNSSNLYDWNNDRRRVVVLNLVRNSTSHAYREIVINQNFFTSNDAASAQSLINAITPAPDIVVDPNANLNSLALSEGSLTPIFSPEITTYTASVPNSVATITVSATVAQPEALFTINGVPVESGASSAPFSLVVGSNTISVAVMAGTSKTYQVAVTRAAPVELAPEIVVEEPAGTNLLDGTAALEFGSSDVGTLITKTVTIRNTGTANLTGLAVSRSGLNASEFASGVLGATTLAPGTSTTFTVIFTPTAAGVRSAALQIASNDANENPFDINLSGTGVDTNVPAPEIAVEEPAGTNLVDDSAALAFGSSEVGSPVVKTLTVRNTGTVNLTGLAVSRSGANASEFALGVLGSTTLAPGTSTTFTVIFTPTAAGARSAALQIASNDADENPFDINLSGTGIAVDPYDITFVGTPYELRVGNQVAFELNRLRNPGETLKVSGKIPTGLKFNALTGLLSGILAGKAGKYQVGVQVLQGRSVIRTIELPITVMDFPTSLIGNFDFLMEDSNSVPIGVCKITITRAKQWSATLESAGSSKRRSAKGTFILAEGSPVAPITAPFPADTGAPAVTVNISLNGSTPSITGTYNGGTLRGFRIAKVGELPPATVAYSLVLDASHQSGINIPAGLGWLRGNVRNQGIGAFRGLLGDGTAASISLRVSAYGQAILWSQPYKIKSSYIGGIVTLKNLGQTTAGPAPFENEVWWTKTADATTLSYPSGFPGMPVTVGTSRWTAPASATAIGSSLGWRDNSKTSIMINGGGLSNQEPQSTTAKLPTEFTLDSKFAFVTSLPIGTTPVAWRGIASRTDGAISGALTIPAGFSSDVLGGSAAVSGVLLQDELWGTTTGCGQIRVPVAGPRGSFKTASIVLGQ